MLNRRLVHFNLVLSLLIASPLWITAQTWEVFGPSMDGPFFLIDENNYLVVEGFDNDIYKYKNGIRKKVYTNDSGLNTIVDICSDGRGQLYALAELWQTTSARLLTSTDNGETWQSRLLVNKEDPHSIHFVNDTLGFITCNQGRIYRTSDGAETWKLVYSIGSGFYWFFEMVFLDATEGYAVGGWAHLGRSVRTTDGGKTWQSWSGCRGEICSSVTFGSGCTGWVSGQTDLTKWDRRTNTNMPVTAPEGSGYDMVHFINDKIGYLAVDTNMVGLPYYYDEILLYRTLDGGATWQLQNAPYPLAKSRSVQVYKDKLYLSCGNGTNETEKRIIVLDLLSAPSIQVADSIVHPHCEESFDGEIVVTPLTGTPPFEYHWSDPTLSGAHATDLSPGKYTVFVSDDSGLCDSRTFVLHSTSPAIHAASSVRHEVLFAANGSITVVTQHAIEPLTYEWSHTDTLFGSVATQLGAGQYSVTITDAKGCTTIHTAQVNRVQHIAGRPFFQIATNPFQGNVITIRTEETVYTELTYTLWNTNGQAIQSGKLKMGNAMDIVTYDLAPGIYFLQLINQDGYPEIHPVCLTR